VIEYTEASSKESSNFVIKNQFNFFVGRGRPFAFECVSSKKSKFTEEELVALENYINSSTADVRVNSLALVNKADIKM
jgi:hypothetical protein